MRGVIEKKSNYGVQVNGQWYNPSKFGGPKLASLEVGKEYDFEIKEKTVGDKTYRNIHKAIAVGTGAAPVVEKPAAERKEAPAAGHPKSGKVVAKAYGRDLSDYEILKDKRIAIQGIVQAVLQSDVYKNELELLEDTEKREKFLKERSEHWLKVVQEMAEK